MSLKRKHAPLGDVMVKHVVIDNSDTIQMGDAVNLRNGNVEVGTADGALGGVVIGLVDKNGNSVFSSLAVLGDGTVSGSEDSGSTTVASDNETVDLITAIVDTSPFSIYSGSVTGTMNTTNASNKLGGWVDMVDEQDIEETTHTRTVTTEGQLYNHGVDPDDSSRMLVSIHEHEIYSYGGTMA